MPGTMLVTGDTIAIKMGPSLPSRSFQADGGDRLLHSNNTVLEIPWIRVYIECNGNKK